MTLSKETLMAYVDGELSTEEMARVEAELKGNAEARSFVDRQQALSRRLHASFDDILEMPVPRALQEAVAAPRRSFTLAWPRLALWTGLPAAMACGLLIGLMLQGGSDVVSSNGALVARGGLAAALTQKLAADDGGGTRIGLSFRDKDGHYCRTFRERTMAGVACREGDDWKIAAAAGVAPESGEYRQAASAMPDAVRAAVTAMIAGEPLSADGERRAREQGWK